MFENRFISLFSKSGEFLLFDEEDQTRMYKRFQSYIEIPTKISAAPFDAAETGIDRCHEWQGPVHPKDGPVFNWKRKQYNAARLAYSEFTREVLDRSVTIKRTCGNPKCVTTAHLYKVKTKFTQEEREAIAMAFNSKSTEFSDIRITKDFKTSPGKVREIARTTKITKVSSEFPAGKEKVHEKKRVNGLFSTTGKFYAYDDDSYSDAYEAFVENLEFEIGDKLTECHQWSGETSQGVPVFTWKGKTYDALKLAYSEYLGVDYGGLNLRRTCGNDMCVNITHARKDQTQHLNSETPVITVVRAIKECNDSSELEELQTSLNLTDEFVADVRSEKIYKFVC